MNPLLETATVEEITRRCRPVFEKHGIQQAILFGSWAAGTQTRRSDIDMILVKNTRVRFFDRYEGILEELGQALSGRDIEVLIYTPEELAGLSGRPFIEQALKAGKVVYESGEVPA
jgi:predicted nucleotidyltransferase